MSKELILSNRWRRQNQDLRDRLMIERSRRIKRALRSTGVNIEVTPHSGENFRHTVFILTWPEEE